MTTVTNPMSLGQAKRIAAISVDVIPVSDIFEIQAKALTSGILKNKLEDFWRKEVLQKLAPIHMYRVMPTSDLSCLEGVIDNIADFKQEEFYFPDGFVPEIVDDVIILPINHNTCIRDLSKDVENAGYRMATPEEVLGTLKEKCLRGVLKSQQSDPKNKIVLIANERFGGYLFVIEYYYNSNKLFVIRERCDREDVLSGNYNIIVVKK